ncbi:MAG: hypothetical protein LBJ16_00935 [Holosporaceae bacterium]|nr:hypothetical protein [Holosporaceae bacterium]
MRSFGNFCVARSLLDKLIFSNEGSPKLPIWDLALLGSWVCQSIWAMWLPKPTKSARLVAVPIFALLCRYLLRYFAVFCDICCRNNYYIIEIM